MVYNVKDIEPTDYNVHHDGLNRKNFLRIEMFDTPCIVKVR